MAEAECAAQDGAHARRIVGACIDCGAPVFREGGRGPTRKRCKAHHTGKGDVAGQRARAKQRVDGGDGLCAVCRTALPNSESKRGGRPRKYCGAECRRIALHGPAKPPVTPCLNCGTEIIHEVRQHRRKKHCSDACRLAWGEKLRAERYVRTPRKEKAVYVRDCAICGAKFTTPNANTITCGMECGKRLADWSRSAAYLAARARTCGHCGTAFVMRAPSGKARRGEVNEGRFCSMACSADAKRIYPDAKAARRAMALRRMARMGVTLQPSCAECEICGAQIQGGRHAKTCSPACSSERARRNARERSIATDQRDRSPRPCRKCGTVFAPEYGDMRKVYCSERCLKRARKKDRSQTNHRKRARHFKVSYEPVNRLKVFERDGWRCQICGCRTPKALMGTFRPNAPELDHRIPMAMGGGHTWANVQCACRSCNGAKGGTQVRGQLPLFAQPGAF